MAGRHAQAGQYWMKVVDADLVDFDAAVRGVLVVEVGLGVVDVADAHHPSS